MITVIILLLSTLTVVLLRILRSLSIESVGELKRRARSGDFPSARLYRLRSHYGTELHVLLTILIIISLSTISSLAGRYYSFSGAVLVIFILYILIFLIGYLGPQSINLASNSTIVFENILKIASPILKYPAIVAEKYFPIGPNKNISSKLELLTLLGKYSSDSKLTAQERKAIHGALTYADKKVREFMIPNGIVVSIKESEELSPVVMGELHASGHSRFPVMRDGGSVVGTLFIKDALGVRKNKVVSEVMRPEVYYLNEEQNLHDALKAFLKTKHHLFMVVNSYEDVAGIITIEDVLEQIIGEKIIDEFDQYDDLKAMASHLAQKKREERA